MKKFALMILALAVMGTALVGCRVEGEVGDTASTIGLPR
jgi:hypothetical protein